jgi:hypothetical protein
MLTMKYAVFWDVTLCGSCKKRHFFQEPHGVTSQKTAFIIFVTVPNFLSRTSEITKHYCLKHLECHSMHYSAYFFVLVSQII